MFRFDGLAWVEEAKLYAFEPDAGDSFGWPAAIFDNIALFGAIGDDTMGEDAGAVYIFRYDGATWQPEQKLLASDGAAGDNFGWYAALHGDLVVVGSVYDDDYLPVGYYTTEVYATGHGGLGLWSVLVFSLTGLLRNFVNKRKRTVNSE